MKSLTDLALVAAGLALVVGLFVGGSEFLNPRRAQGQYEQMALKNERARADFAYQEQLRVIELEKQRQMAQREAEIYAQALQRRAETVNAVIMVVGGILAAGALIVAGSIAYYSYERTKQLEMANGRPRLAQSAPPGRLPPPTRQPSVQVHRKSRVTSDSPLPPRYHR